MYNGSSPPQPYPREDVRFRSLQIVLVFLQKWLLYWLKILVAKGKAGKKDIQGSSLAPYDILERQTIF